MKVNTCLSLKCKSIKHLLPYGTAQHDSVSCCLREPLCKHLPPFFNSEEIVAMISVVTIFVYVCAFSFHVQMIYKKLDWVLMIFTSSDIHKGYV